MNLNVWMTDRKVHFLCMILPKRLIEIYKETGVW